MTIEAACPNALSRDFGLTLPARRSMRSMSSVVLLTFVSCVGKSCHPPPVGVTLAWSGPTLSLVCVRAIADVRVEQSVYPRIRLLKDEEFLQTRRHLIFQIEPAPMRDYRLSVFVPMDRLTELEFGWFWSPELVGSREPTPDDERRGRTESLALIRQALLCSSIDLATVRFKRCLNEANPSVCSDMLMQGSGQTDYGRSNLPITPDGVARPARGD